MFKNWMKIFMLCMMTIVTMASCDRDEELAINMSGEWRGDFGVYYTEVDRYGREYTYRATDTYLRFIPDHTYATYGTGTEVDYYDETCRYECGYYQFTWEVRNGSIYMEYRGAPEMNVRIDRYHMDASRFSGRIGNTEFNLYKIASYYDWSPYCNGHGYYNRYGYTRAAGDEDDAPVIIRRGNIMNEQ